MITPTWTKIYGPIDPGRDLLRRARETAGTLMVASTALRWDSLLAMFRDIQHRQDHAPDVQAYPCDPILPSHNTLHTMIDDMLANGPRRIVVSGGHRVSRTYLAEFARAMQHPNAWTFGDEPAALHMPPLVPTRYYPDPRPWHLRPRYPATGEGINQAIADAEERRRQMAGAEFAREMRGLWDEHWNLLGADVSATPSTSVASTIEQSPVDTTYACFMEPPEPFPLEAAEWFIEDTSTPPIYPPAVQAILDREAALAARRSIPAVEFEFGAHETASVVLVPTNPQPIPDAQSMGVTNVMEDKDTNMSGLNRGAENVYQKLINRRMAPTKILAFLRNLRLFQYLDPLSQVSLLRQADEPAAPGDPLGLPLPPSHSSDNTPPNPPAPAP